jgi:hypothetical protein
MHLILSMPVWILFVILLGVISCTFAGVFKMRAEWVWLMGFASAALYDIVRFKIFKGW